MRRRLMSYTKHKLSPGDVKNEEKTKPNGTEFFLRQKQAGRVLQ